MTYFPVFVPPIVGTGKSVKHVGVQLVIVFLRGCDRASPSVYLSKVSADEDSGCSLLRDASVEMLDDVAATVAMQLSDRSQIAVYRHAHSLRRSSSRSRSRISRSFGTSASHADSHAHHNTRE